MFSMSKDIHFCWVGIPWQRSVIGDEISRQPLDQSDGAPHVWGALLVFDLCELRLLLGKVSLTLFGVISFNDIKKCLDLRLNDMFLSPSNNSQHIRVYQDEFFRHFQFLNTRARRLQIQILALSYRRFMIWDKTTAQSILRLKQILDLLLLLSDQHLSAS